MPTPQTLLADLCQTTVAPDWQTTLADILAAYGCQTGTLHALDPATQLLRLRAQVGIPPHLLDKVAVIPVGKGMAGIAAERRQPVQLCNLQTDDSGVARPSAKDTKVEGSLAVPLLLNGALRGTLGIAKTVPYDFDEEEVATLLAIGEAISRTLV